jgi:hypothetical protein
LRKSTDFSRCENNSLHCLQHVCHLAQKDDWKFYERNPGK